jgi:mono/diheme cytochrome c family protein
LAGGKQPVGKAPFHAFASVEIADIQAFAPGARDSLSRLVPAEFAERYTRLLNCTACHGQLEGFPPLELLGSKLKPEWSARFIGGEIPHKIRYDAHPKGEPWLEARMPAFKAHAPYLAAGLAARDGFPPSSAATQSPDQALAQVGRKLVGKDGGFSCVSCHGVGSLLAMEVFESEGINLVYSADRLQPDFYRRWLRAPTSIDSQTKMPVYFDEGKSPLTEILGGDGEKQIDAIWAYLQLRDKMQPPATGAE